MHVKHIFAVLLTTAITAGLLLSGCGESESSGGKGEPTVIRIAHNYPPDIDPTWRDPVTGETRMGQQELNARLYAEAQVLEKFNVDFSWVGYPNHDITEELLRSVLANDPMAEVVLITTSRQGVLLAQNVLQPLDDFESLFQDEDSAWMLMGKVFGRRYFLNESLRNGAETPLVYNIGMLNKIPALKENGKTVLPADLWMDGKWTWNVFEDYLQKIQDFYRDDDFVYPYGWNFNSAWMAMHSNGASVYGDRGFEADTPKAKEAIAYIERLMAKELLYAAHITYGVGLRYGGGFPMDEQWRFREGGYAFVNMRHWAMLEMVRAFNERGDTMGIVPFPRPDHMKPDDPEYRQMNDVENSYAIPRGVSKEKTELAVRAFREYMVSYYKHYANSDRALDFLQSDDAARASAIRQFLDITNEEYGEKILAVWKYLGNNENHKNNEYIRMVGLFDPWVYSVLVDSLFRANGASAYSVQIEAKMPVLNEVLNNIQRSLDSTEVRDNIPPRFTDAEGAAMVFPAGTDTAGINWNLYMQASDNVDGAIDFSKVTVDPSRADFNSPGRYENAVSFSVTDAGGNEGRAERTVIVFDAANTSPPRLVIRNGFRGIALNEDTANISWRGDFVESATDRDGLDLRDSVFADLSELNTTVAGGYPVTLFVKDYAGNEASAEITVVVE